MVPSRSLGSGFTSATLPPGRLIFRPVFSQSESCDQSAAFLGSECVYFVTRMPGKPGFRILGKDFTGTGKNSYDAAIGIVKLRTLGLPGL